MKSLSMYLGSIIGNNDTCLESLLDDEDLFYDHEKDIVIILDELRKQKLFFVYITKLFCDMIIPLWKLALLLLI